VQYEFVLRAAAGATQVVRETHRLGAFRRASWLRLLAAAGFAAAEFTAAAGSSMQVPRGRRPAHLFTGRRPVAVAGWMATGPDEPGRSR
jgi:hypothetical protein